MARQLRIATRSSPLARWQAERVAELLGGDAELVLVESLGDRVQDVPLHEVGGQGIFVKEVQAAVLDGRADLAVHSAKDLPASPGPEGLVLACVPERGDVRDCLVGSPLTDLPEGSTVATGSVRRKVQLAALRPDLRFVELRGNIQTRLGKVPERGSIVMAVAALQRLGLDDRIAEVLEPATVLPQVGQGALAVECRTDDAEVRARLAEVEHASTRRCVDAERSFLARMGGGCDEPLGALAADLGDGRLHLEGLRAAPEGEGHALLRSASDGTDPWSLGVTVAEGVLAR